METLHTEVGQAKETLATLREMIRTQRLALGNGKNNRDLALQLRSWEEIVAGLEEAALLEKSARLSMLHEISRVLNASLDWEETVQAVIDAVISVTGAERGMLVLRSGVGGELEARVLRGVEGQEFSEEDLRFSRSIVEQTLQQREPLLATNAQLDPRFDSSESIIALGLHSIICAPLLYNEEALGVIYLENRARAGIFTQDDLTVLKAFTNQAAIALANAQIHSRTDLALANRVQELSLLQDMAHDLNTSLDFERVMERSLTWAATAAGAGAGALALVTEEGVRWVAYLGDVEPDEARVSRAMSIHVVDFSPRRIILPLFREERPLGAFYLTAGAHPFNKEKVAFVSRLADNAALAIENARLYEALRNANLAKSEFVSLVSHELRTPMTSIRGYADMLSQEMMGELNDQQREFIEAIRRNANRMRILVRDLLDISRIETGRLQLNPTWLELENLVAEARQSVEDQIQEKEQVLTVELPDSLPPIYGDADRMTQILINLLGNAVKYTPEGGAITVHGQMSAKEPGSLICAVSDTGVGISPEDQRHLFTKFFRSDDPSVQEQTGTGLGLAITRSLIEMHGGKIWVKSSKGQGSTFAFTVPLSQPED
ncbi:MAG: ATP-binding protein [Anaerolineales bacterium]